MYFQLVTSRGSAAARQLLHDYAGILMSDDYVVYSALERARTRAGGVQQLIDEDGKAVDQWTPDYLLATCWMHARRYLFKAEPYHPDAAGPALDLIAQLYQIEDDAKAQAMERCKAAGIANDDDQAREWLYEARRRLRQERSRPCIEQLDEWRKTVKVLEGSALAEATAHLDKLWSRLVLFLDDPQIPLENGHAERQIRVPIAGRNSYQGCRSEAGARVAALFFSLIGTARNLGLNPVDYITAVATKARKEPGAVLTPWDYAESLRAGPPIDAAAAG